MPQGTGNYTKYFHGTTNINGLTAHVLHFSGGVDDGLSHFWSESMEGDKLFHGSQFRNEAEYVFYPPVLMVDEPIYVGKAWETYSHDSDGLAVIVRVSVTSFGEVTTPAGAFQAFTIEDTWEWPEAGHKAPSAAARMLKFTSEQVFTTRRSYVDGVGVVLESFGSRRDQLISINTVSVESATWTGIRLLYE